MKKITTSNIVKVEFYGDFTEHYFGSLAAIYEVFTPEQIGCTLESLWSYKIEVGKPKKTRKCIISKHNIYRKQQKNTNFADDKYTTI